MELGHWVTGSMGHFGHLSRPAHRVTGSSFWPGVRPEFFRFSKKCPKCKTYIWNAEITKVIVGCLLLDWNHWMSVHAMNLYFYLWLLKILWTENTSSHISPVSGSLDSRVTGSLGHKMWPSSISVERSCLPKFTPSIPSNQRTEQCERDMWYRLAFMSCNRPWLRPQDINDGSKSSQVIHLVDLNST